MDNRRILEQGTQLFFPAMECTIDSFVGKGSNAIVYIGSYPDEQSKQFKHRVLIKELFPYHPQGQIFRNLDGTITCTEDAKPDMELHKLSFMRGNDIHLKLLGEHPAEIDSNINTFFLHQTLYSVLGFSGGRSLDKEQARPRASELPLTVHIRRILGILDVLEVFHQSGFLHMDISPDNILLIGEGKKERISLIDYNSVHTLQEIREGTSVYYSEKEGYTAPEIRLRKISDIGFASDLYSLTAVFYRLLTGKSLSILQTIRGQVPDIADAPCLLDVPDTVYSMVKRILKRGLSSLVSRRYQTVTQMRQDFEELQDRIDGKGITHPALWEMGKANVLRVIRTNPAFRYIKEEEQLYPILGETRQNEVVSLAEFIKKMISPNGESIFLIGNGGAGKTTALLRAAYLQPKKYSSTSPAFLYLSLYGWSEGKPSYIKDRILESLKFKPDTSSMEIARHELIRLLSTPMYTKSGERPKLLILLDGLNEISGDMKELIREISELSNLNGVRILLTSRSEIAEIPFPRIDLRPLEESEVRNILAQNGILPPEQKAMFCLLSSPMMLSIYIRTALDQEKQLFIDTQDQLLDRYFTAILSKEIRELPENSKEHWQIEAALSYLLPELAKLMNTKGRALSDSDLLPVVEKCYRRLNEYSMLRIFPQWIGHIAEIRGETKSAEEWYGRLVHGILWRKLGLIVRDEQGSYRIAHQLMEEYLVRIQKSFHRKFVRYERVRASLLAAVGAVVLFSAYKWIYLPNQAQSTIESEKKVHYEKVLSENVLDAAFLSYIFCADQYEAFSELLACIQKETVDEKKYDRALANCQSVLNRDQTVGTELAADYLDTLLLSGEVMPWSEKPLQEEIYRILVALPTERIEEYQEYLEILLWGRADDELWNSFGKDYLDALEVLLEADAYLLGSYYNQVVAPELTAMKQSSSEEEQKNYQIYMKSVALVADQDDITEKATKNVEIYKTKRRDALGQVISNGLLEKFKNAEKKTE